MPRVDKAQTLLCVALVGRARGGPHKSDGYLLKNLMRGQSVRDLIVFNGTNNLDFQDIRTNVIRIPEVVIRLRQAQEIWDKLSANPLDLTNFVASENSVFLGNIRLKSFATAIVQIGLLDRYLKTHTLTEFVVGAVNGDSPLRVAIGDMTFYDMVASSSALAGHSTRAGLTPILGGELPILSGMQLAEYGVFKKDLARGGYQSISMDLREVDKLIFSLVDEFEVKKIVMIGPGSNLFGKSTLDLSDRDVQVLESIDLDPMLSWFWSRLRENRLLAAN